MINVCVCVDKVSTLLHDVFLQHELFCDADLWEREWALNTGVSFCRLPSLSPFGI